MNYRRCYDVERTALREMLLSSILDQHQLCVIDDGDKTA